VFGQGSVARLGALVDELGRSRALVICGRTVAGGPVLRQVSDALGARHAGTFDGVRAHTPFADVERAANLVAELGADVIVTVGGGSAIDAGKGVVLLTAAEGPLERFAIDYGKTGSMARARLTRDGICHVSVPTTAGSASDVMPTAGIRDPKLPKKLLFWDEKLVPNATILDPELAVHAAPALTAATGMTAMARAVECLYSKHRHPISTALALHAARLLRTALPRSVEAPGDLAARADCLMASLMSGTASINAMVSVVHAIGHVVGGRYGLQHGISHAMLLAPALRRLLPAIGADQAFLFEALGCPPASATVDAAAQVLDDVLQRLPLPKRLREVGVAEADLPDIAHGTLGDYMMANLPRPKDVAEVQALLEEAW
jgi:alcohol dehydrogenase class IV